MTESLHLQRPAEPSPLASLDPAIQTRTVEHYRLVNGLAGDVDPDLPSGADNGHGVDQGLLGSPSAN